MSNVSNDNKNCCCHCTDDSLNTINSCCNNTMIENEKKMCDSELREELIHKIKCYNFAVIELSLYLDTHPDDEKALCLHRKYAKELKNLKDQYQKVFGPLSIYFPCNKWRWLESPWPWEGGNF